MAIYKYSLPFAFAFTNTKPGSRPVPTPGATAPGSRPSMQDLVPAAGLWPATGAPASGALRQSPRGLASCARFLGALARPCTQAAYRD